MLFVKFFAAAIAAIHAVSAQNITAPLALNGTVSILNGTATVSNGTATIVNGTAPVLSGTASVLNIAVSSGQDTTTLSTQTFTTLTAVTGITNLSETRYGIFPLTGTQQVSTLTQTLLSVSTNIFQLLITTRSTITVTPSAITTTDTKTATATSTTTVTSVPAASTLLASYNWFPIINTELATATPLSRFKRGSVEARGEHDLELRKRQTIPGNTAGYIVDRNGTSGNLNQTFPYRVVYSVQTVVNVTGISIVTGAPEVVTLVPTTIATATAETTTTVTVIQSVVHILPTPTVYAACLNNNVGR
jgi:hypothetical protein